MNCRTQLETLHTAVRDIIVGECGEAYHEMNSRYVGHIFGWRKPWFISVNNQHWHSATMLGVLAQFRAFVDAGWLTENAEESWRLDQ